MSGVDSLLYEEGTNATSSLDEPTILGRKANWVQRSDFNEYNTQPELSYRNAHEGCLKLDIAIQDFQLKCKPAELSPKSCSPRHMRHDKRPHLGSCSVRQTRCVEMKLPKLSIVGGGGGKLENETSDWRQTMFSCPPAW